MMKRTHVLIMACVMWLAQIAVPVVGEQLIEKMEERPYRMFAHIDFVTLGVGERKIKRIWLDFCDDVEKQKFKIEKEELNFYHLGRHNIKTTRRKFGTAITISKIGSIQAGDLFEKYKKCFKSIEGRIIKGALNLNMTLKPIKRK